MPCRGLTLVTSKQCRAWLSPNRAQRIPFHRQAEGFPPGPQPSGLLPRRNRMTSPTLRYGRRPPKNAPALRLAPLLTGNLPAAPTQVDYGTDFTGWQMLGNDAAGDCVAVTWANQRALVTTALSQKTDYPSQAEVWTFYKTQNPTFDPNGTAGTNGPGSPADGGMDIQTALEYLRNTGGPGGVKAVAFARVDFTNENELRSAHAIFGQVWYGINVLVANQTEFSNGQVWDYVAGSPLDGGHSITGVGYDPTDYRFVTWAQETDWTEAFRTHQVEEAWVVIWPEHLGSREFEQGINLQQLAADYQTITGQPLVIPPQPSGELQVLAVTSTGLWHTIRHAAGDWIPAGDAGANAHIPGTVQSVTAASSTTGELQVLAVTSTGLWHTIRHAAGDWTPAGNAGVVAEIPGTVQGVTAG